MSGKLPRPISSSIPNPRFNRSNGFGDGALRPNPTLYLGTGCLNSLSTFSSLVSLSSKPSTKILVRSRMVPPARRFPALGNAPWRDRNFDTCQRTMPSPPCRSSLRVSGTSSVRQGFDCASVDPRSSRMSPRPRRYGRLAAPRGNTSPKRCRCIIRADVHWPGNQAIRFPLPTARTSWLRLDI